MATNLAQYFGQFGVITEEQDFSVITTPDAETLSVMAIGFSKKGQFNKPLLVTNNTSQAKMIGMEDRNLERKGSFLHRTVSKLTPYAPVYVMNLLATDDTLDRMEYNSLSSATNFNNDIVRDAPYRRYFDTSTFWERSTDKFINITKDNVNYESNLINITNFSDKYITVFIVKSSVGGTNTGFDVDFRTWYGTSSDKPEFVHDMEWVSDYMVDVLVVSGDFTNYHQLTTDARWSQYFTTSGLKKESIRQFANDIQSNTLAYHIGVSLIPNFRDTNGKNIYIENVINSETDLSGLYCAVNEDLLFTDYRNGLIDMIGYGLVGSEQQDINFLSYQDNITETLGFNRVELDAVGNVIGIKTGTGTLTGINGRTDNNMEGFLSGVNVTTPVISGTDDEITYNVTISPSAYYIINGTKVTPTAPSAPFIINSTTMADGTFIYYFVIGANGVISMTTVKPDPRVANVKTLFSSAMTVLSNEITGSVETYYLINATGFNFMVDGAGNDYIITSEGQGSFKVEFLDTDQAHDLNTPYVISNRIHKFNEIVDALQSPNKNHMTMLVSKSGLKHSCENVQIDAVVRTNTENKSFILHTGLSNAEIADILTDGILVFYREDNEFILGTDGAITTNDVADVNTDGVIGKYSDFYQRYYNGSVNTGDYFEKNVVNLSSSTVDVEFDEVNNTIQITGGLNYGFSSGDVITIRSNDGNLNANKPFTITNVNSPVSPYVFTVDETIVLANDIIGCDYITNGEKIKLSAWLVDNETLNLQYTDEDGNVITLVDAEDNQSISLVSGKSNYKESLDVVYPVGYVRSPNKILVNATRYSSLRAGDFLEANWIENEEYPEETPRTLTRIVRKIQYQSDPTLVEITCDAEIKVSDNNQATKYSTIDKYVSTYKGIKLKGFRVRKESMPDGTEERQQQILSLVEQGTPLFRALTNKSAISFRYLVDTFGLGLTERSKQQYADICGKRLDCFGIISAPSMKQFANSSSPSFVDNEYNLVTEYIAQGANPESNATFLFSLAIGAGATCIGYFAPYIDLGNILVPPAMYVAETYLQKVTSTNSRMLAWTICAGSTNGRVQGIPKLEMLFDDEDVKWLAQARINPIVYKRTKGYSIETEFTALRLYTSSLSYIHSREVLIELEGDLRSMLLDYHWKFNTASNRAEIKLKADQICDKYVALEGLYRYFNKCDGENNTVDYIDNQIGRLDTGVEIVKGMGLIINNVQVYRTGGIESSGFAQ
jgi:hypothetical protein